MFLRWCSCCPEALWDAWGDLTEAENAHWMSCVFVVSSWIVHMVTNRAFIYAGKWPRKQIRARLPTNAVKDYLSGQLILVAIMLNILIIEYTEIINLSLQLLMSRCLETPGHQQPQSWNMGFISYFRFYIARIREDMDYQYGIFLVHGFQNMVICSDFHHGFRKWGKFGWYQLDRCTYLIWCAHNQRDI